jgi:type I restriction enzyme S subunit
MSPKNHFYRTFIYLSLTQKNTIDYFSHIADGGAYPAIRPEVVFSFLTIKPLSVEIFKKFDDIVYPLFHKLGLNAKQSRACVKIRDTLLPKLLSGELRIPDAEKIATELL